jgi:hypothetical protein
VAFASLTILETLLNLLNKRPHIQLEFNQSDGYSLLQRIYISIASLNKFYLHTSGSNASTSTESASYFGQMQKKLFIKLINGCFQSPVFYLNSHSYPVEKIELTFNLANEDDSIGEYSYRHKTSNPEKNSKLNKKPSLSNVHLINADLLAQILVEWDLWRPMGATNLKENRSGSKNRKYSDFSGDNIWQHMFKILNKLLEDGNPAQMYHSNLFLKHGLLEKLMHFLLDANSENYHLDQESCQALIDIFKHFNTVFNNTPAHNGSSAAYKIITKQLFANFSDYLYILHSERNVYIVNQKNEFYFHLSMNFNLK